MKILAVVSVLLVAVEHVYILVLEMFLWTRPRTRRIFGMTAELSQQTRVLAANQGLYNGFLAAGLFWGLGLSNASTRFHFIVFFLVCVMVAGLVGGFTAKKSIMVVQALPAAFALLLFYLAR